MTRAALKFVGTRRSPYNTQTYDVGDGEMLTIRQIATRLRTRPATVRQRIFKGWRGAELMVPPGVRRKTGQPRVQSQVIAYTLAQKFGRRIPSVEEIQKAYPMGAAAAAYWRNAIIRALERTRCVTVFPS